MGETNTHKSYGRAFALTLILLAVACLALVIVWIVQQGRIADRDAQITNLERSNSAAPADTSSRCVTTNLGGGFQTITECD